MLPAAHATVPLARGLRLQPTALVLARCQRPWRLTMRFCRLPKQPAGIWLVARRPRTWRTLIRCSETRNGSSRESRKSPPQPRGAWLPFGVLPGADEIYSILSTPQFEIAVACVVLISLTGYAISTLPDALLGDGRELLARVESITTACFAVEYCLRWWSRSLRPSYLVKPLMLIDLLSVLPSLLTSSTIPGLRGSFAFLRVLRILKLQRYVRDEESFTKLQLALGLVPAGSSRGTDLPLARVVSTILSLLFVTAGFLYEAEPQVPNYFASLYYGLTTLATIGTIEPQTPQGALVVSASIIAGIAIVPFQLSRLAEAFDASAAAARASRGAMQEFDEDEPVCLTVGEQVCTSCSAVGHRADAEFCFACGAKLPPMPAVGGFSVARSIDSEDQYG